MANKEELLEVLKGVIDPEIGINIVDLGLVYEVESAEDTNTITMTLTTPRLPNAQLHYLVGRKCCKAFRA